MATPEQLVDSHTAAKAALTAALIAAIRRILGRFGGWYSGDDITVMAERVTAQVEAAQRQTAALTDAYLSRVSSLITGESFPGVGPVDVTGLRKGTSHQAVYGRITNQFRYDVSRGIQPAESATRAVERAVAMAETDLDLAQREQAREFMVVRQVDGWRRIVHPELSAGGTCGLCIIAANRVYRREELMAIHDRCKCTVLPIINGLDPGKTLNGADLKRLYEEAGGTAAAKLKRTRYTVHQHGELGPVLRDADDAFRDSRAVNA